MVVISPGNEADLVMQDLGDGRETIGRAGRVGVTVLRGLRTMVVHAKYTMGIGVDPYAAPRREYDPPRLFRSAFQMNRSPWRGSRRAPCILRNRIPAPSSPHGSLVEIRAPHARGLASARFTPSHCHHLHFARNFPLGECRSG